ncbi:hypothetical protein B0H14DRAFT_3861762 [Mycena olivaceomarginata]|nr:hypothetical protein B0H14DRAFT_3861762 [Mycena olivaceomarginata]
MEKKIIILATSPSSYCMEKAPPSAWVASGREAEAEKKAGRHERGVALLEVRSHVRVAELYKTVAGILPRYPALRTLLLTRPPDAGGSSMMGPSVPSSPRSPSMLVPSPPSTQRAPCLPPSPWLHAPPSPSASLHLPPSLPFDLAPPPELHTSAAHPDAWGWEWEGWGDAGDVLAGATAQIAADRRGRGRRRERDARDGELLLPGVNFSGPSISQLSDKL